jgi:Ran GTPase-activating protein (RanGAP) involved in mRNA processing and transport
MNALAQALRTNYTLRALGITNCGITALAGAGVLALSLKHNSSIQRINLQGNEIGDDGFQLLWDDVIRKCHPSIISLNVSNNKLTDASMANLYGNTEHLQELYLDGNQISDRGALDLAKAIMDRETLKILSVGNNPLMTHRGKNTLRFFAPNRLIG